MIIRILAFLLICSNSLAQNPIGIDTLMRSNRVKTKTQLKCNTNGENCKPEIIYRYDSLGRLETKSIFSGDTLLETNRYEYFPNNLASKVYTSYRGGKEFLNIKYGYGAKDKMTSFDACYPDGRCEPFEKYKYFSNGKLQSRIRYKDGKYFYEYRQKYDKLGNNIEVLILSNDSDSGERELKTYDGNGRHISSKWIDYRGDEIDNAEYTYDENGRLLKNEWIGGLTTQKLYKYDSLGNNIEYTSIDYTKQIDDHRLMQYQGNLIKSRIKDDGKSLTDYAIFIYEFY